LKIIKEERKRSKALILLLLPAVVFIWMIGWSLYWIGHQKERQKAKPIVARVPDYVHLMPMAIEEPLEARSE
jgi:flagellar basal body-associated protein FliL